MSVIFTTDAVTIEEDSPAVKLLGEEGSADPCWIRENLGNVEIYDVSATAATKKTSVATGRRIDPTINATELVVRGITNCSTGDFTLTAAALYASGIFYGAPAAGQDYTTHTGAQIGAVVAASGVQAVGTCFEFTIVSTTAQVITLTAGASGVILVGLVTVAANTSGTWICRMTAASTCTMYRK